MDRSPGAATAIRVKLISGELGDAENPPLQLALYPLFVSQRRVEVSCQKSTMVHLRQPPSRGVGVLLIGSSITPVISVAKDRRVHLRND